MSQFDVEEALRQVFEVFEDELEGASGQVFEVQGPDQGGTSDFL